MYNNSSYPALTSILNRSVPYAIANIEGNEKHPGINGIVKFYPVPYGGILIEAEIFNLPYMDGKPNAFFGFHIHEKGDCSNSFKNTGNHFNPCNYPHPFHAGDMPPLMSNSGYAWMAFYDAKISICEIMNRSVVIHHMPDDFTTQPSGDSGDKIACGVIVPVRR